MSGDGQYEKDKLFFGLMFRAIEPNAIPADIHPVAVLERMEKSSPAKARQGLRIALGDLVEQTTHLPDEAVVMLDKELAARNASTLSEVRLRFSRQIRKALKTGRITDETTYYLMRNAEQVAVDGEERERMRAMLAAYEG